MKTIHISAGNPYDVTVGSGLLEKTAELLDGICKFQTVAIVTDDIVEPLYLERVKASFPKSINVYSFAVPHGEQSKSAENLLQLYSFFSRCGITRSDLIIALGGGVVGDLTGFAASSYLRGVRYVQIPTTLLAQVDSSVGGKTAINIPQGKNLVGSFYQPCAVLCDTSVLNTLKDTVFHDGVAEIIKYGCICDKELFEKISQIHRPEILEEIILRCISIKAEAVAQDEHDTGRRMILNFGHTIGHAVEKFHHFTDYTHGQGVAIGMVHITRLSEEKGITRPGTASRIEKLCRLFDLPTQCDVPADELFRICCLDKKNMNSKIHLILLSEIGSCLIQEQSHEELKAFLN